MFIVKEPGCGHDPEAVAAVSNQSADEPLQLGRAILGESAEVKAVETHQPIHGSYPEHAVARLCQCSNEILR